MAQIGHVVFDLGKVLVYFSYSQLFPLLRKRGALLKDIEDFADRVGLVDYELGRISSEEFLQRGNALLSAPLDMEDLKSAWCAIFAPNPQMLNLARQLRGQVRTYIISNTSALHWDYLKQRFAFDELCDDCFASYEVGYMKPATEIYRLAEERFGFAPAEAVFIDDRSENVAGAISCGWQGIVHRDYGQTCNALIELGIKLPVS